MAKIKRKKVEDITHPPNTFSTYAVIALVLAAFLVLVFVARAHINAEKEAHIQTLSQKQQIAYQDILTEVHIGVRLARWQDFIEQGPESKYTQMARLKASVLQGQEQTAWAHYTEHIYTLPWDAEEIASARELYLQEWGRLIRGDKLSQIENTKPPKPKRLRTARSTSGNDHISSYASVISTDRLIGGPRRKSARSVRHQAPAPYSKSTRTTSRELRVKTARTPHYPSAARRRKVSAEVVLSLNIDDRGRVVVTKLVSVEAKRYRSDFIRAAKRAARRSRFYPKLVDGHPVNTSNYIRTYSFTAEN